jgi:BlaI family transcriptional regulator, penicillinase repressor
MPRKHRSALTPGELRIMKVLWGRGPSTAAEVTDALLRSKVAKNTVLTMLKILERKGQITHSIAGRSFVYRPLLSQQTARRTMLNEVIGRFFDGSRSALLLHILEDKPISLDDARRIRTILASVKGTKRDT